MRISRCSNIVFRSRGKRLLQSLITACAKVHCCKRLMFRRWERHNATVEPQQLQQVTVVDDVSHKERFSLQTRGTASATISHN